VLAEGVERQEEMIWLRRHGCQIFQGFYFARPMPEADFLAFARDGQTIASLFTPKSLPFSGSAAPHARIAG
jgi:sensor c-di-GMP phosphodiesterase-like protein